MNTTRFTHEEESEISKVVHEQYKEITDLKSQNKELIESLKEEQARIVLLSDGYDELEVQHKKYLNVLKIYLESVLESINSKNQ